MANLGGNDHYFDSDERAALGAMAKSILPAVMRFPAADGFFSVMDSVVSSRRSIISGEWPYDGLEMMHEEHHSILAAVFLGAPPGLNRLSWGARRESLEG
jgi:hypothetical protein